MANESDREVSVEQFKRVVSEYSRYFLSKWILIISIGFFSGLIGITYAWLQKPVYTAEIIFASESEGSSGLGGYAGLAAQFGFDGGGGSGAFEGENLIELMRSKLLIEKTLLTPVDINGKKELLINYYIRRNKYDVDWEKKGLLSQIEFKSVSDPSNRMRDSILTHFIKGFSKESLNIYRIDKKLNFVSAQMRDEDELFAKVFIEQLVNNVIQFYVDYKVKKSKQNVDILKKQADLVRSLLSGNIVEIAVANDLNVNPTRQVTRSGVQRKQVDVQVNSAVYGELVKNLEMSRVVLRKETPLIQIIDTPRLPLEKKKMGRLLAGVLFAFAGSLITLIILFFKKMLQL